MKVEFGKLSEKYIAALLKMRLEADQRKVVTAALRKIESHYAVLLEESRCMQEQLRLQSHQILFAQEEERKRISRELHDEIGQILAGVNIKLAALTNVTTNNTKNIKRKIASTQQLVEKSMQTIHQFARELRPAVLDDIGLISALHAYMKDFTKRTRIPIRFKVFNAARIKELDSVQRTAFFRVAQEGLSNIARHSKASLARVSLVKSDGVFCMEINDNGKSFSLKHPLPSRRGKRLGLLGMQERMEMIGGSFTVEASPGKGTTLRAQAPFRNPKGSNHGQSQKGLS